MGESRATGTAGFDSALVSLALEQLGIEIGRGTRQETQAFALVAIDVALAIADVSARSSAGPQVLALSGGFRDYWWAPLLGLALSAVLLLIGTRGVQLALGPLVATAHEALTEYREQYPDISETRALALAIEGQRLDTANRLRSRVGWVVAGRAALLLSVFGGTVLFVVVR